MKATCLWNLVEEEVQEDSRQDIQEQEVEVEVQEEEEDILLI